MWEKPERGMPEGSRRVTTIAVDPLPAGRRQRGTRYDSPKLIVGSEVRGTTIGYFLGGPLIFFLIFDFLGAAPGGPKLKGALIFLRRPPSGGP